MHEHSFRRIGKYLARTSTYPELPDGNIYLSTRYVVYIPDKEKAIEYYVDDNFPVVVFKHILTIQKISCRVRDM